MRKHLGPQSLVYPEPVLIIGTYNEDKTGNAMNAAWGGVSDYNQIFICLANHKTTDNIMRTKAFTVSFATKEYVKESDYLGLVSGNKVKNKLEKVNFHIKKAKHVNAPIIEELPVALECKLISYDEQTGYLFGDIVDVSVDPKVMTKGKVDLNKFVPIMYDGLNHNYHEIGKKVGTAYKDGKAFK